MKRKKMFWASKPAIIMIFILFLWGCATTGEDKEALAPDPNVLRVGVTCNYYPLIFKNKDEQIAGLEVDFANGLAAHLKKSAKLVELEFDDLIPALRDNRIDIIMSGMSITKSRQIKISFANPYYKSGQMVLISKKQKYKLIDDFEKLFTQSITMDIGVIGDTTGDIFVRDAFPLAKSVVRFSDQRKAADALVSGKIDAFVHDASSILMIFAEYDTQGLRIVPKLMTEEYLAWGVAKNNKTLLEDANQYLKKLKMKNVLRPMVSKWMPSLQ